MSFDNHSQGFILVNEQFGFDKNLMEIEEDLADIELDELIIDMKYINVIYNKFLKCLKQKIKQKNKGIDKHGHNV